MTTLRPNKNQSAMNPHNHHVIVGMPLLDKGTIESVNATNREIGSAKYVVATKVGITGTTAAIGKMSGDALDPEKTMEIVDIMNKVIAVMREGNLIGMARARAVTGNATKGAMTAAITGTDATNISLSSNQFSSLITCLGKIVRTNASTEEKVDLTT